MANTTKETGFTLGDTVRLRAGPSPTMTVAEFVPANVATHDRPPSTAKIPRYRCTWFAGKKRESALFYVHELMKVDGAP